MMLPNLISVSVMPGCWAVAVVAAPRESSAETKAAGTTLLDRIMLHSPRRMADNVVIGFEPRLGHARGTGLAFSCWTQHASVRWCGRPRLHDNASRSTQVCAGQIGAS